jgi:hypothetical protein
MDDVPAPAFAVPPELVAALDDSADDLRAGRIADARDLLSRAEDRLRALRQRGVPAPRRA